MGQTMAADQSAFTPIPDSDIRSLYNFLRDYPRKSLHLEMANAMQKKPEPLAEMLLRSFQQCIPFNNWQQPFHNGRGKGEMQFTEQRLKSEKLANRVLVSLAHPDSEASFPFSYVDYEIRPFRVDFRVGKKRPPNSVTPREGQIDILMVDKNNGSPIIGEIKAKKDATLLLALIQSLASAVEFATPNQRARLAHVYSSKNSKNSVCSEVPGVGVCLIQALPPSDDYSRAMAGAVRSICKKLMESPNLQKIISRITCQEVHIEQAGRLVSKEVFDFSA